MIGAAVGVVSTALKHLTMRSVPKAPKADRPTIEQLAPEFDLTLLAQKWGTHHPVRRAAADFNWAVEEGDGMRRQELAALKVVKAYGCSPWLTAA
jgi:hypothetical protein